MKKNLSNLALAVIITFISVLFFGPATIPLGGCGTTTTESSGTDDDTENGDGVNVTTLGTLQTAVTDSNGSASVTGDISGKSVTLTIANTSEQALSGLNVEYIETTDATYSMAIVSDPNMVYQTALVTLDTTDLSALSIHAFTTSGEELQTFIVTTATLITITLALLTAKTVLDIATGVYELYCDPPTLSAYGASAALCVSPDQIITSLGLAYNTYSLMTMGSLDAATQVVQEGTKKAYEVVGGEILEEGAVDVAQATLTSFANFMSDSERNYDSSTNYCVLLYGSDTDLVTAGKSARYSTAADITGTVCTTADDCTSATGATAAADSARDRDEDGETADTDCNDTNAAIHTGAVEICGNSIDEDCIGADNACTSGLTVEIISPGHVEGQCQAENWINGVCYGDERALTTMATITGGSLPEYAYIYTNGRVSKVEVGAVPGPEIQNISLYKCNSSGWINQVAVVVNDGTNFAVDEIAYGCNAEASELLIMLFWNQCGAGGIDLDLYVREPDLLGLGPYQYAYSGGPVTANGGSVTDGYTCYGPAYYVATSALAGEYQIRVHYMDGGTTDPEVNYTLYIITNENFDQAQKITGTISAPSAVTTGTANFSGSGTAGWSTNIWTITKNAHGYWSASLLSP